MPVTFRAVPGARTVPGDGGAGTGAIEPALYGSSFRRSLSLSGRHTYLLFVSGVLLRCSALLVIRGHVGLTAPSDTKLPPSSSYSKMAATLNASLACQRRTDGRGILFKRATYVISPTAKYSGGCSFFSVLLCGSVVLYRTCS